MPNPHYWLMKSEPQTFSIDDLAKAKNQSTLWDGVRNYQARNTLRHEMKPGDLAFFYHSSCPLPGITGIVKIMEVGIPDPTAFDPRSPYFDPKSDPASPRWYSAEVKLVEKLNTFVLLSDLRQETALRHCTLLQRGNRLSVFLITPQEWHAIQSLIKRNTHAITK